MYFRSQGKINKWILNIDRSIFCGSSLSTINFQLSYTTYLISVCFEDTNNKRIPSFSNFDFKGSDLKRYLKPAVVVVTGDLTDAKTADYSGSEQYIEEWQTYQHIVHSVTNNSDILWLDIRGNHDNFDVPSPLHR